MKVVTAAPIGHSMGDEQMVTYSVSSKYVLCKAKLPAVIKKAFRTWEAAIPTHFKELEPDTPAYIEVAFKSGDHKDYRPFDRYKFVAHGIQINHIHFNYQLPWSINKPGEPYDYSTNDLYTYALFAIGAMLGVAESDDPKSIMYPKREAPMDFDGNYIETILSPKDITAVQRLYGPPDPMTFTVYAEKNQMGKNKPFPFYNDNSCYEFKGFYGNVSSIYPNNHCIELFENSYCEGKKVMIKPGCTDGSCCNPKTFEKCKFDKLAMSYRACQSTCINVLIWNSVVIVVLIVGFLLIGIVFPWLLEILKLIVEKFKRKHYGMI
uniref:Peptidase M10 metallopeptidase domain-containing protein n=1 Tax=Panagrolaimus davidi TaxID=227884 RepID=A0A914Q4Z8_9BILA